MAEKMNIDKGVSIKTLPYIRQYCKIRTKKAELVLLEPNPPQMRLYNAIAKQYREGKPIRIIILKARQMGFSTMTGAIIFKCTSTERLVQSAIITHKEATTNELFDMYKRFYNELPVQLKPQVKASNAKELVYNTPDGKGLDSKIKCLTATDDGVGRGGTTQYVHMSEFAFWKNPLDTYYSVMQCVPDTPNSMVIIESTANGYNMFKELWDKAVSGKSDFVPLFFAWFEMAEYRKPYNGFVLDEYEEWLVKEFHLDNEQLAWRRWKIANDFNNDVDLFKQEFPATPEEAFLFSGNSYFNMEAIKKAKELSPTPEMVGHFKYNIENNKAGGTPLDYEFEKSRYNKDEIKIYKDVDKTIPYVIGADTAGEGSDAFVAQVINNINGEVVATMKFEGSDELHFTEQLYCLGMYYNEALLSVEVNFSTYPQKTLEQWQYPNFFVREKLDTNTGKYVDAFGFKTTTITRPNILANLQSIVRDSCYLIKDYDTLTELETFVKNEKGKPEAMVGCHDDCVMALAIAYNARGQQSFKPKVVEQTERIDEPIWYKDAEKELEEGDEDNYVWN